MAGHIEEKCTDDDCNGSCPVCCLFVCAVCGCYEGSLATECPGERVSFERQEEIYARQIDFIGGQWVARKGAE